MSLACLCNSVEQKAFKYHHHTRCDLDVVAVHRRVDITMLILLAAIPISGSVRAALRFNVIRLTIPLYTAH